MAKSPRKKGKPHAPSGLADGASVVQAPPKVAEVLEQLNPRQQAVLQPYVEMAYSGPIPPAQELGEYDRIIPNGADRIMSMAEREQAHRHDLERRDADRLDRVVDNDILLSRRGQQFGGWLFFGLIGLAGVLVYQGELAAAAWTFLGSLILQGSSWFIARTNTKSANGSKEEAPKAGETSSNSNKAPPAK